ncbi:MAG TPA: hypothetical protein PK323_13985 [Bacteroidia bacterium]|nr:hypothetical protein [Bacteroidia bacterium]
MKYLNLLLFTLSFCVSIKAQDSLNSIKNKECKWQLHLNYSYCYNNRNTWLHLNNSNIPEKDILNYIDTAIIPCYTKRTSVLFIGNISRFFAIQFGLNYGRTGYLSSPIIAENYYGQKYALIKSIPELRTSITAATRINIPIYKNMKLGLLSGIEINPNSQKNYYDAFYRLKNETKGLWGIKPTKKINGETIVLHGGHGVGFVQFNIGFITQINISKRLYISLGYDYFSQFKKGLIIQDRYSGNPTFSYYLRPYVHSFSIGIGVNFYK